MNRLLGAVNLCIVIYFIYGIIRHLMRPKRRPGFTRMLMFACMATIPMIFLVGFTGGYDRIPRLPEYAREIAGTGPFSVLGVIGLAAVVILLPLAIFAGVWFVMELRSAFFFVLYFIPLLLRMATSTAAECILFSIGQAMLFLLTGPLGALGVVYLERHDKKKLVELYTREVRKVWRGYDEKSSANFFVWSCLFALCNQFLELLHAVMLVISG